MALIPSFYYIKDRSRSRTLVKYWQYKNTKESYTYTHKDGDLIEYNLTYIEMIYDFTRKEKHLQPAPLLLLDHQFRQSGITGDCWFANKKKILPLCLAPSFFFACHQQQSRSLRCGSTYIIITVVKVTAFLHHIAFRPSRLFIIVYITHVYMRYRRRRRREKKIQSCLSRVNIAAHAIDRWMRGTSLCRPIT